MQFETLESKRLRETVYTLDHPSGVRILVEPKPGYTGKYAIFGTRYGSIDNAFSLNGENVTVPEGIAHFLEHKLFESEDGDAFARFARTGASANAYTSFDRTCYLFSCTQNFEQSLEILLDFVQHPYFTEQTVHKEQGIIGQEIRMYLDDPNWRVFFNLLDCLYVNHPVKIDIAGTQQSISEISADLLYKCYNAFYNLNNMVLAVSGDVQPQQILSIADRMLKPAPPMQAALQTVQEPDGIRKSSVRQRLSVSVPLFCFGFKGRPAQGALGAKNEATYAVLQEILASDASPLYRRLYDTGLINASFGMQYFSGRSFAAVAVSGESREPEKVQSEFLSQVASLKRDGIAQDEFDRAKKTVFGRIAAHYDSIDEVANVLAGSHLLGMGPFDIAEAAAAVTKEDVLEALTQGFDESLCALSVVEPS